MDSSIKKGQYLWVKAPPYYAKEYLYEITSAGDKLVRANLHNSPKVRKSWPLDQFELLINMGMIRFASAEETAIKPDQPA